MGKLGYYVSETSNPITGATLYAAKLAKYSVFDEEDVANYAVINSQVSESALQVGMAALTDAIINYVMNGHSVTLKGLGTFFVSSKTGIWSDKFQKYLSAGKDSMDEVSTDDIKGVYVRFKPCTTLRNELNATEFFDIMNTQYGLNLAGKTEAYKNASKTDANS